jgi:hypothetical protein
LKGMGHVFKKFKISEKKNNFFVSIFTVLQGFGVIARKRSNQNIKTYSALKRDCV